LEDFKQGLVAHLHQRQAQGQRRNGAPPFDHAKLQPLTRLFTKVTFEKVTENGVSDYQFVLRTKRFEEALRVVRAFPLSALPVNLPLLRESAGPKAKLPRDAELWIEWYLSDPEPGRAIDKTIIPFKVQAEMASLNQQSRRFRIVLEEETLGFLGKPRRELIADHAPFVLDWRGVEGIAAQARAAWQDPDRDQVDPTLELLEQRLREHGPATGLETQLGDLYRLIGRPEQAIDHYVREVQLALRPEGRPGLGALTALRGLGAAFQTLDELEFARAAYRLALTLNPNDYEALIALAGLLEDFGQQLLCLSRACRLRPDEAVLKPLVQQLCAAQPETADDVWQVIQEASPSVDLTQPVPEIALANPAAVLRELLPEVFVSAAPERPTPANAASAPPVEAERFETDEPEDDDLQSSSYSEAPVMNKPVEAAPAPKPAAEAETRYVEVFDSFSELEPVGASLLETVRDAGRVLVHFALSHLGPAPASDETRWRVGIENVTEFGRNGALTPRPGATLQLASDPEVCVRVMLADHTCTVHLMQEFQIPNTPLKGLKPAHTEQCLARADALLDMLNNFVARGLLVKLGRRLLYFDPA
jgi:tetratricopeptide (TPR) repeat protein